MDVYESSLSIEDGGLVEGFGIGVGLWASTTTVTGTNAVTGTPSELRVLDELSLLGVGGGSLTIDTGAIVSCFDLEMGVYNFGATPAQISVSGAGSTLAVSNLIQTWELPFSLTRLQPCGAPTVSSVIRPWHHTLWSSPGRGRGK